MYAVDTNILIHYANRESNVVKQLERWINEGTPLVVSTIVEAELFSWPKLSSQDLKNFDDMMTVFTIAPVDSLIARTAASLRQRYRTPLHDTLIAATAFTHNAPLVTRNTKDFSKIEEIELIKI